MSSSWAPPTELAAASLARVWDNLLGGKNAFQLDRDAVDKLGGIAGNDAGWRELAAMQRRFVDRAVIHLVGDLGVRQIVDVGCGFPNLHRMMNVHEIAQLADETARVLYVDQDPNVVAHTRALLPGPGTAAIEADIADPATILDHEVTRRLLDLDQPYAILLAGVLHHLTDEQNPIGVTEQLKAVMPAGSYLVVSNFLGDDADNETVAADAEHAFDKIFEGRATARFRPWEKQLPYLLGLDPVPPGLVYADDWQPDEPTHETPVHTLLCAGVGRKTTS